MRWRTDDESIFVNVCNSTFLGNPGRDFRGATDGLVRVADPEKFYKLYQSAPLGSG